jgi:hypothetical protein
MQLTAVGEVAGVSLLGAAAAVAVAVCKQAAGCCL